MAAKGISRDLEVLYRLLVYQFYSIFTRKSAN